MYGRSFILPVPGVILSGIVCVDAVMTRVLHTCNVGNKLVSDCYNPAMVICLPIDSYSRLAPEALELSSFYPG